MGKGRYTILDDHTNDKALTDTTGLMIARMFKEITGSDELLQETAIAIGDDNDRVWGIAGTLMNLLYQYVTDNGRDTSRWKELVDHLCSMLDIPSPE